MGNYAPSAVRPKQSRSFPDFLSEFSVPLLPECLIWGFEQPDQKVSNRSFYTKPIPSHAAAPVQLQLTHLVPNADYRLEVHRTGYHANDAYSAFIEMGSPKELSVAQIEHLKELTRDLPETDNAVRSGPTGTVEFAVPMNSNDVVLVKVACSRADN